MWILDLSINGSWKPCYQSAADSKGQLVEALLVASKEKQMLFKTEAGCLKWGQRKGKPPRVILQLFPQECGSQDEDISRQELACVTILQEEQGKNLKGLTDSYLFYVAHTWNSPATVSRVLGLQMFTIPTNYNLRLKKKKWVWMQAGQMTAFGSESSSPGWASVGVLSYR